MNTFMPEREAKSGAVERQLPFRRHDASDGNVCGNAAGRPILTCGGARAHIDGVNILNPSNHDGDDGFDIVSSSDVVVENTLVRTTIVSWSRIWTTWSEERIASLEALETSRGSNTLIAISGDGL